MNIDLSNKNALVCGSTQGIGRATAIELASLGANVTLMARNEDKLRKICDMLPNKGQNHQYLTADFSHPQQNHQYLTADFSHPQQVKGAIEKFLDANEGIHILVNNTGGPPGGKAFEADPEEYRVAFNLHLISNQVLAQALIPFMKEANYGRIINIISTSVKIPINGLGVSNTIRGAVANWSKTLANELGEYGITVNNVLPGSTKTARLDSIFETKAKNLDTSVEEVSEAARKGIPARRFAEAEEVAYAIAFLSSSSAAYINGVNLPVDGGRTGSL
jgi:3-oxoacyl-[acyl-carrier protein] reductase